MPLPDYSPTHVWVGAATVPISNRKVRRAYLRQSVRVVKDARIDVLEIYCSQCRRPYDDVRDEMCSAAEGNEHLRGGPIGERKKRAHHRHSCILLGCDFPTVLRPRPSLFDDDPAEGAGEDEERQAV
ncbi:hypothetical protein AB0395_21630 [Streptosporangium sp. NPDC051023]|uniref:hypothetical protein n=1 Tax=Streptosporangium sp. NPDC051023 TaxID=3155410 RepID=UPI00344FD56C